MQDDNLCLISLRHMNRIIESVSGVFAEISCEKNRFDLWNHISSLFCGVGPFGIGRFSGRGK